mgnify:CR=1 FL=1
MRDETQRKADARLARIEGQLRAVRKMVAEDRYCIDVVRQVQAARSRAEVIVGMVTREKPTLRQLLAKLAGARGHFIFAGTPEQVADELELWFKSGAADGFNLMPPIIPWMLEVFVEEVVPLLQQRGLFREEYKGKMLRDHYGLERPGALF